MNSSTPGFSQICFQTPTNNVCLSVQDLTQIQTTNGQQAINTQGVVGNLLVRGLQATTIPQLAESVSDIAGGITGRQINVRPYIDQGLTYIGNLIPI